MSRVAKEQEVLAIGGREVVVTNPSKVYFPESGLHQVRCRPLLPGGRGRRAARRPAAGRWRSSGSSTASPRSRSSRSAPRTTRPGWIATAELTFPSRPDRRRDRRRGRGRAGLGRQPRLHRPQSAPGPRRRPGPPRRAPGGPRPRARRRVGADPRRRDGLQGGARGGRARRLAEDVGLARDPHQRPDRAALDVPGGPPGGPRPGPGRGATGARPGDPQVVEGGAPRRLPRLQPERQGPDGRLGLLGPAAARRPGLDAADVGRGPDRRGRGVHDRDGAGAVRRDRRSGGRHRRRGRLARGAARAQPRARGRGRRATPVAAELREAGRRAAAGPAIEGAAPARPSTSRVGARAAGRRRRSPPSGRPPSRPATRTRVCRPSGPARGRHRPAGASRAIPVIEIARAAYKAEALEGLDAGRRAIRRRPPRSSPPTSSSMGCAAGRRSGIASG